MFLGGGFSGVPGKEGVAGSHKNFINFTYRTDPLGSRSIRRAGRPKLHIYPHLSAGNNSLWLADGVTR
jgi:hypothetical protein